MPLPGGALHGQQPQGFSDKTMLSNDGEITPMMSVKPSSFGRLTGIVHR